MMDVAGLAQVVVIAVLALFAVVFVHWVIERGSRNRLMRCPETGAVAFVGAERVSRDDGKMPEVVVRSCEFWPERKDCARGCLARYDESTLGYRVRLDALRPFERP